MEIAREPSSVALEVATEIGAAYLTAENDPYDARVVAAYKRLQSETDRLFAAAVRCDRPDSVRIVFTRCREPYEPTGTSSPRFAVWESSRSSPRRSAPSRFTRCSAASTAARSTAFERSTISSATPGPGWASGSTTSSPRGARKFPFDAGDGALGGQLGLDERCSSGSRTAPSRSCRSGSLQR